MSEPTSAPIAPPPPRRVIRSHTQKVKGLLTLARSRRYGTNTLTIRALYHRKQWYTPYTQRYRSWKAVAAPTTTQISPTFARPCPVRPRHGFVESRVVSSLDELNQLVAHTLSADPRGQIMLTPVYPNVILNTLWTPSSLTIGAGHDGATSGKDTVVFPLHGPLNEEFTALLKPAGVDNEHDPYVEGILHGNSASIRTVLLTQLRAGPKGDVCGDYIPVDTLVSSIIHAGGDLLAWERTLQQSTPGTVIYHPGGSPTDHYTVHARTFQRPVMFSRCPIVGETLTATQTPTLDPAEVFTGMVSADQWIAKVLVNTPGKDLTDLLRSACTYMLAGFHHASASGGVNASRIFGFSVMLMLRLGYAAAKAESRYERPKYRNNPSSRLHNLTREKVWKITFNESLTHVRGRLNRLINLHRWGDFGAGKGTLATSFGGFKWAQCALSLVELCNGIRNLARDPTPDALNALIRAMNIAVNQAHNGGWWLGKFVPSTVFDAVQQNDPLMTSDIIIAIWKFGRVLKQSIDPTHARATWSRWPLLTWRSWQLTPQAKVSVHEVLGDHSIMVRHPLGALYPSFSTIHFAALANNAPMTLRQDHDTIALYVGDHRVISTPPLTPQGAN